MTDRLLVAFDVRPLFQYGHDVVDADASSFPQYG